MCTNCGCETNGASMVNLQTGFERAIGRGEKHDSQAAHPHAHGHRHEPFVQGGEVEAHGREPRHPHFHEHADGAGHDHPTHLLEIEARILAKNDAAAARNRAWLSGRDILALNFVSSPGSGKTTLLEHTIGGLAGEASLFVIEGDQATANDGERIRQSGAAVVQVNTGTGCHLDAQMVAEGLAELNPNPGALVFIENVGNLVCPALFDLGERAKVVIFSTTEGEDKPLKYPHMFRAAALVILNKIDLLPYLEFSMTKAVENLHRVNPDAHMIEMSAKTGEGLPDWYDWIRGQITAARSPQLSEVSPDQAS